MEPEENRFRTLGSWTPAMPSEPLDQDNGAPRSIRMETMRLYSNRFFQENARQIDDSNSSATASMNPVRDSGNRTSNLIARNHHSCVVDINAYSQAFRDAPPEWNVSNVSSMQYTEHLAFKQPRLVMGIGRGSNAASSSAISYPQINNDEQQSNSATLLFANQNFVNQNFCLGNNMFSGPSSTQQMHQYGFGSPYNANIDLNSSPKSMADIASNGMISSFQIAPITPDEDKRVQNVQPPISANLFVEERVNQERKHEDSLQDTVPARQNGMEPMELCTDQGLSQPVNQSCTVPYNPFKENEKSDKGEDHGIELNKKHQKPKRKRKKHMPKVVREGKPKRTPTRVTPKQACNKENPSREKVRKYVRKSGTKVSVTPPAEVEVVDFATTAGEKSYRQTWNCNFEGDAGGAGLTATKKSCRRALSFASEGEEGSCQRALSFASEGEGNNSVASQIWAFSSQDRYEAMGNSSGSKSILQFAHGLELELENSSEGFALDLNRAVIKWRDKHIVLPVNLDPLIPGSRKEPSNENMKILASNEEISGSCVNGREGTPMHQYVHTQKIDCRASPSTTAREYDEGSAPSKLQNGFPYAAETQHNSNSSLHVLLGNSNCKRKRSKREYSHTVSNAKLHPMNLNGSHFFSVQNCKDIIQGNAYYGNGSNQSINFPDIYNKKRMKSGHNGYISNASSSVTAALDDGAIRETTSSAKKVHVATHFTLQTIDQRSFPQCNIMDAKKKAHSGTNNTLHEVYALSVDGEHSQTGESVREVLSRMGARKINPNKFQGHKGLMGINQIEVKTKKRSKGSIRVRELASLMPTPPKSALACDDRQESNIFRSPQACMEALAADNHPKITRKRRTKKSLVKSMSYYGANQVRLQEHESAMYAYHQSLAKSKGIPRGQKSIGMSTSLSKKYQLRREHNFPANSFRDLLTGNFKHILDARFQSQAITRVSDPRDEIVQPWNISESSKFVTAQTQNALVPYGGDGKMVLYEGPFDHTKKRHPRPKVDLDPETNRVWKLLMSKEGTEDTERMDATKEKYWEEERRVFHGRAESFIARMHLVLGDRRFSRWKGSVVDSVVGVFLTQNVSDHLSSSAFMALAARFPIQSRNNKTAPHAEGTNISAEEQNMGIIDLDETINPEMMLSQQVALHETEPIEEKEIENNNESIGSDMGGDTKETSKGKHSAVLAEAENRRTLEDAVSSQNSVVSFQDSTDSQIQIADRIGSTSESYSEAENLITGCKCTCLEGFTSFTEVLQMTGTNMFEEFYTCRNGCIACKEKFEGAPNLWEDTEHGKKKPSLDGVDGLESSYTSIYQATTNHPQTRHEFRDVPNVPSSSGSYDFHTSPESGSAELDSAEISGEESRSLPSNASEITEIRTTDCTAKGNGLEEDNTTEFTVQQRPLSSVKTASVGNSYAPVSKNLENPSTCSNREPLERNVVDSNSREEGCSSKEVPMETTNDTSKAKKVKSMAGKTKDFDWDSLRRETYNKAPKKERSSDAMDSLDWEAVRLAEPKEISDTIRERGMNNVLAGRIKDFLNRLEREHGSPHLEWLRDVPPDKAKEYLLSIRGLGLKSTECVRLLTLHHIAFPVDTNVGRICVRLGWVPLQPLPESLQLHLLEMYPVQETIQKYLWPRLCKLDQRTLYELHYQMITFGKVFCTKNNPNCNACPMRAECKHFASAYASARRALPGPEEKSLVTSAVPISGEQGHRVFINPMPLPPPEGHPQADFGMKGSEPIIEEPPSPEPESIDISESAIEDAFWQEDPDEIPTIKLNFEEFTLNVQNYMQVELQDGDMSKALVALTPEAASIPMPKLKNVSKLRTEHQVYELQDSHPLLEQFDRRETDDPCSYLLAIWTPGETAQSTQPPEIYCNSGESGKLCEKKTCFACSSVQEEKAQTVRGTILIPSRTAMRGSFPLNGTYFQVNEVFADHESSLEPIDVPRAWLWNLPRRTVYFGTSVTTIFRGLTIEGIQHCFWRGFLCVRGFERVKRQPRPLVARLHLPASKLVSIQKNSKTPEEQASQKTSNKKS
ncbi:protein ROS1A-like [Tasmannia lanceolata]|uniref:protein ROS1A-like n=1 Tax=Tasmannia lanceolata TaxID=3420 RepID=UPI00406284D5